MANDDEKQSALARYLAKQKQDRAKQSEHETPKRDGSKVSSGAAQAAKKSPFKHTDNPMSIPRPALPPEKLPEKPLEKRPEKPLEQPAELTRWQKAGFGEEPESKEKDLLDQRAIEFGAPVAPPLQSERSMFKADSRDADLPQGALPGDFGTRFVATLVDWAVLAALGLPARKVATGILALAFGPVVEIHTDGIDFLITAAVIYAYYGYFYSQKGASPGKLLLNLEVLDSNTGRKLTPWKAFFREAIGKFISSVPFLMGYLIVLFREDRKALHDLLFDTHVVTRNG